jgi:hypothetical protein
MLHKYSREREDIDTRGVIMGGQRRMEKALSEVGPILVEMSMNDDINMKG